MILPFIEVELSKLNSINEYQFFTRFKKKEEKGLFFLER